MPVPRDTLSEKALADALGVVRTAVTGWRQEGCPFQRKNQRYEYVLSEVVDWRLERARRAPPADADEAKERALKMKADRELAELKLAERRRELVEVSAVIQSDARIFGILRARVGAIRGKWAPRVMGLGTMAEATAVLDALADDVLASLADGADEMDSEQEAA